MYDLSYYNGFRDGSRRSAKAIVPLIMDWVAPTSVLDLGCGMGDWLAVFKEAGVREVCGVDGDYVLDEHLAIPRDDFRVHDLASPYLSDRRYTLAISLEVAEHLPQDSAGWLVRSLTDAAPLVLFSAAIPNQPGKAHINCQWPDYWADLFDERGYVAIDALRLRLWNDSRVDWWYRQNTLFYASASELDCWPNLKALYNPNLPRPLSLVHPEMFQQTYRDLLEWGVEWEKRYWKEPE